MFFNLPLLIGISLIIGSLFFPILAPQLLQSLCFTAYVRVYPTIDVKI
jgi:hypothetical protein